MMDGCGSGDSSCHKQTQLDQIELQIGIANQKLDKLLNVGGIISGIEGRVTKLEVFREENSKKSGPLGVPIIGWFVIILAMLLGQLDLPELFRAIIK